MPQDDYIERLKNWKKQTLDPFVFDNIQMLLPEYDFRKSKDRWISPKKLDLSAPKVPVRDKTVFSKLDMCLRENGDWDRPVKVYDLLQNRFGCRTFFEIQKELSSRYGLGMPAANEGQMVTHKEKPVAEILQNYFEWNLLNSEGRDASELRRYLEFRGLPRDSWQKLGLGFVPDWSTVENFMQRKHGISPSQLEEKFPVKNQNGETLIGGGYHLAIPFRRHNTVAGFLFRTVYRDTVPKYRASKGLDRAASFFNMSCDRRPKELVIVEGEMDALCATAAGIPDVVAIGGSDVSGSRRRMVEDALTRNVRSITLLLDLDRDREGNPNCRKRFEATKKSILTILDAAGDLDDIRVARFPFPTDPADYLKQCGAQKLKETISSAVPWWKYLHDHYASETTNKETDTMKQNTKPTLEELYDKLENSKNETNRLANAYIEQAFKEKRSYCIPEWFFVELVEGNIYASSPEFCIFAGFDHGKTNYDYILSDLLGVSLPEGVNDFQCDWDIINSVVVSVCFEEEDTNEKGERTYNFFNTRDDKDELPDVDLKKYMLARFIQKFKECGIGEKLDELASLIRKSPNEDGVYEAFDKVFGDRPCNTEPSEIIEWALSYEA